VRFIILGLTFLSGIPSFAADVSSGGVQLIEPMVQESKLLGKPMRVEQHAQTVNSGFGVMTSTQTELLGHSGTLVEASVEAIPAAPMASATPSGLVLGTTDLYIGGTRIWTGALRYQKGSLTYSGGVAPTQIPFPIFAYPLGPVMLRVDAGIEFEGEIDASLTPGLSYPLADSTLDATLSANLGASGFVEGYAGLWIVRAGVGGRVDLIEGTTGVTGHIYMNGITPPSGHGIGMVRLLSGDVYGFVDTKFFFGRWNRVLHKDFFKWGGYCYSFGAKTCATP
jgi:hypothetical protein